MATLILTSLASSFAGSFGLSAFATAAISAGAGLIGNVIDQALFAKTTKVTNEGPRLDEVRFQGSNEGANVHRIYGRTRIAGNIIWTTRYREEIITDTTTQGGGKGGGGGVETTTKTYNYYVSCAVGLCDGPVQRIGRIWADGAILDESTYTIRRYNGTETQNVDPKILSTEGADQTSAYRGTAYVVFEEMLLEAFGNRIPQMNFEVTRSTAASLAEYEDRIRGITIIPSAGEFAYDPVEVFTYDASTDASTSQNNHTNTGETDWAVAIDQMESTFVNIQNGALVVTWHGTDLRCNSFQLRPKVETATKDTRPYVWEVTGIARVSAQVVSVDGSGRPNLGGTPSDLSVFRAIQDLVARGIAPTFYPFILMDIPTGNALPDPYGGTEQASFPWRGRITLQNPVTDDETAGARTQVNTFFGTCTPAHFGTWNGNTIPYTGPAEWSFRRMILHYAKLCAAAGGVDTFIIGSEMRAINLIRDNVNAFPGVDNFITLAADVSAILGAGVKVVYASDWSEWQNYRPTDGSNDVYFHLDPLYASADIDAIAIDNYMPIADWRDNPGHLDSALYNTIYDLDYLQNNITAGELVDWFYASQADRDAQVRTPITDGVYGDPWIYRIKDLFSWWSKLHRNMPGGLRNNLISNGNNPRGWAASTGSPTLSNSGSSVGPYVLSQQLVVTGTALRQAAAFTFTAGVRYKIIGIFEAVTAVRPRLRVLGNIGTSDIIGAAGNIGAPAVNTSAAGVISNITATNIFGNTWRYSFEIVAIAGSTTANIALGAHVTPGTIVNIGVEANTVSVADSTTTAWVPQSKPIWFTELGCPNIDKGPNQPNVFVDPKSSESFVPYYSNGLRDDFIARQFNLAHYNYWGLVANNPVSTVYSLPMVDVSRIYIWTWDSRPFPEFPFRDGVWSDGANWELGHWLNGRAGLPTIQHVLDEQLAYFGVSGGTTEVYGTVLGYVISDTMSMRDIVQPLMQVYNFDAFESEGLIKFKHRGSSHVLALLEEDLVYDSEEADLQGPFKITTAQKSETPFEVRLKYINDDYNYTVASLNARRLVRPNRRVSDNSLNIVLPAAIAQNVADIMLVDAHVQRDVATFKLPPSLLYLDASDIIQVTLNDRVFTFRLDELGYEFARPSTAVRTEANTYGKTLGPAIRRRSNQGKVVGLSKTLFMDLPILNVSTQTAHGFFYASSATPWPGSISVYRAPTTTFLLDRTITTPSVTGLTTTILNPGPVGIWDELNVVTVIINGFGTLQSADELDVLAGANAGALYNLAKDEWEVFQWTTAVLVAANTYELTGLLRGQLGTEHAMQTGGLPIGSDFVVLQSTVVQSTITIGQINLPTNWRYGPSADVQSGPTYDQRTFTPRGIGMRPYSPCQLSAAKDVVSNDIGLSWVRRTRIGGDVWDNADVALSENTEAYEIDIYDGTGVVILRTMTSVIPSVTYTSAMQTTDFGFSPLTLIFEVFQMSDSFGRGMKRRHTATFLF